MRKVVHNVAEQGRATFAPETGIPSTNEILDVGAYSESHVSRKPCKWFLCWRWLLEGEVYG